MTIPSLKSKGQLIGGWAPTQLFTKWKTIKWTLHAKELKTLKGVRFIYTHGDQRLEMRNVVLRADGKKVAEEKHLGFAGTPNKKNFTV